MIHNISKLQKSSEDCTIDRRNFRADLAATVGHNVLEDGDYNYDSAEELTKGIQRPITLVVQNGLCCIPKNLRFATKVKWNGTSLVKRIIDNRHDLISIKVENFEKLVPETMVSTWRNWMKAENRRIGLQPM